MTTVDFDNLRICLLTTQELDVDPFPDDDWPCDPRPFMPEAQWHVATLVGKEASVNQVEKLIASNEYDVILGEPIFINEFKTAKFIKKGLKIIIKNPFLILNKSNRNIKFHFDLMHGENNLNKAIDLLDNKNKEDFRHFVNTEVSFNPHNMFICRSKKLMNEYFLS